VCVGDSGRERGVWWLVLTALRRYKNVLIVAPADRHSNQGYLMHVHAQAAKFGVRGNPNNDFADDIFSCGLFFLSNYSTTPFSYTTPWRPCCPKPTHGQFARFTSQFKCQYTYPFLPPSQLVKIDV
jgi:hypothetical protein